MNISEEAKELFESIGVLTTGTIELKNGFPTGVIVKRGGTLALIQSSLDRAYNQGLKDGHQ